ncbi:hypothetical protein AAAC51_08080 [Priestia megaterium]
MNKHFAFVSCIAGMNISGVVLQRPDKKWADRNHGICPMAFRTESGQHHATVDIRVHENLSATFILNSCAKYTVDNIHSETFYSTLAEALDEEYRYSTYMYQVSI